MDGQRLRQISDLCAGQAFDYHKSVAEIMAEHIIVKENEIGRLTAERDALRAALESAGSTLAALSYMAHDWMGMGTLEQYKGMVDVNARKAHEAYERVMAALSNVA